MAGTDFSHLTTDELIKGIKALDLPDYIRSKAYGIDVRETLAQMTEMLMQLAYNQGMDPQQAKDWVSKLNNKIDKGEVTMSDLTQEVKEALTGGAVAVVGKNAVGTENIKDASVTTAKLDNSFGNRGDLSANTDLKTIVNQGVYFGQPNGNYLNAPANLEANRYFELKVDVLSPNWAIQKLVDFTTPSNVWHRTIHRTNFSVNNAWEFVGTPANASVNRVKLSDNFSTSGTIASGTNIDTIVKEGVYLGLSTSSYASMPSGTTGQSFVLKVQVGGAVNSFITQELIVLGDSSKFYKRLNTNADNPGTWSEFKVSSSGGSGGGLTGKTIVQFGDSIYGNKRPPKDISTALANKTGATVFNLGIGGSRMGQHQQYWDATSMYRLADTVATGDYTLQDELIAEYDAGRLSGLPYYTKDVINTMKTINWDNVDIITIAHGTNDLTADALLDTETNEFDTTTYGGALRYTLKTILEAYPHIKVFVISPMYRFWTQDNAPYDFIEDSDETVFSGGKLPDFVKKAEEVSAEFKTHYIDAYNHFGIGKSNRHHYFDDLTGHGGTHHNDTGAAYIGSKLASEISSRV